MSGSGRRGSGLVAVLGERNFRLFFTGYVTSLVGSAMVPVALTFAVLDEGRGTSDVGYVLAAETVPLVVLLLAGGVIADRLPRRVVMLSADVVRAVSEGLLAVLLLTGSPPLWVFMVLAGVIGAGQAFFNPALTGLVPLIASAPRLQQANALTSLANSTGQIAGPALAGVIVAAGGAGWAIAVDGLTYAISAACLALVALPPLPPRLAESFAHQLRTGWREFTSRTWLWVIVAQFGLWHLVVYAPFMVLGAAVFHSSGGAAGWGLILAAQGAGAIVGALAMLHLRPARPLAAATVASAAFAIPILLLAVRAPTVWIAAGAVVSGMGLATFGTMWETTMQREVPPAVLSRVSAYDWLGSVALSPIGFALAGPLAASLGVSGALWLGAAWTVAGSAVVLAVPGVRQLRASPV